MNVQTVTVENIHGYHKVTGSA